MLLLSLQAVNEIKALIYPVGLKFEEVQSASQLVRYSESASFLQNARWMSYLDTVGLHQWLVAQGSAQVIVMCTHLLGVWFTRKVNELGKSATYIQSNMAHDCLVVGQTDVFGVMLGSVV